MKTRQLIQGASMAVLLFSLFSCLYAPATYGDDLIGKWRSLDGEHTLYVTKPHEDYWVMSRKRQLCGHFSVDVYPIREEKGFLYLDAGFYVGMEYDPAAGRLRLRPGKEYKRIYKPKTNPQ